MSEGDRPQRPDPGAIRDAYALVASLRQVRAWSGNPSEERLIALAGRRKLPDGRTVDALPATALTETLAGVRLPIPPSRAFVTAFVTACLRARGCTDTEIAAEVRPWHRALERISASEPVPPVTATPPVTTSAPATLLAATPSPPWGR